MSETKFIITFEARPDTAASLGRMLVQARQDLLRATGCRGARLFSADDSPCVFTLMEDWESKSAHQAHVATLVASGAWEKIASQLANEPTSRYVSEL